MKERQVWALTAGISAALGGMLLRRGMETGWRRARGDDPPSNPMEAGVGWRDALAWAALGGLAMGVGRVLAQRIAASGWKRWTGHQPPL